MKHPEITFKKIIGLCAQKQPRKFSDSVQQKQNGIYIATVSWALNTTKELRPQLQRGLN